MSIYCFHSYCCYYPDLTESQRYTNFRTPKLSTGVCSSSLWTRRVAFGLVSRSKRNCCPIWRRMAASSGSKSAWGLITLRPQSLSTMSNILMFSARCGSHMIISLRPASRWSIPPFGEWKVSEINLSQGCISPFLRWCCCQLKQFWWRVKSSIVSLQSSAK